jgi:molybdate transport system regulatory protein
MNQKTNKLTLGSSIWIDNKDRSLFGKGRIELLRLIDETGSLSKAAQTMNMSYKAAWDALKDMNEAAGAMLTQSAAGGKKGGGSALTMEGRLYIKLYERIYEEQKNFFASLEPHIDDYDEFTNFLKRGLIRTSARNQFRANISNVKKEDLMSEVRMDIGENIPLVALVTSKSVEELGLKQNVSVWCVVKSSWIKIAADDFVGENVFSAKIENIERRKENFELFLSLKGGLNLVGSFGKDCKLPNDANYVKVFIDKSNIILGV